MSKIHELVNKLNPKKENRYPYIQAGVYAGFGILNDVLRIWHANPSHFLDQHMWDFSMSAAFTSIYYTAMPKNKKWQIPFMLIPTATMTIYEFMSKSPYIVGTYDPKDIAAYALGAIVGYAGIKLYENKNNIQKFFGNKISENTINNLEKIVEK